MRRSPLSPHGRARMAGSLPLQRMQDAIRRGFRHEPQDARGRCQAHQRRAEVLDTPPREWRAGQILLFLRNLRDTPLAHRWIRLLEHQTRHARRFVAVGTALRGMDEAQGALANDRRARGQPPYTARDSGPGLSPENLSRLFEPFYMTKPEGMGLGPSICRSIIEAHGGRLWAIPSEPQGALFQFTIPAD